MKHEVKCYKCGKHVVVHDYASTDICPECMSFIDVAEAKRALEEEKEAEFSAPLQSEEVVDPIVPEAKIEKSMVGEQPETNDISAAQPENTQSSEGVEESRWKLLWYKVLRKTRGLTDLSKLSAAHEDVKQAFREMGGEERAKLYEKYAPDLIERRKRLQNLLNAHAVAVRRAETGGGKATEYVENSIESSRSALGILDRKKVENELDEIDYLFGFLKFDGTPQIECTEEKGAEVGWEIDWKKVLAATKDLTDFSKFDEVRENAERVLESVNERERCELYERYADQLDTTRGALEMILEKAQEAEGGRSKKMGWLIVFPIIIIIFMSLCLHDASALGVQGMIATMSIVILIAVIVSVVTLRNKYLKSRAKTDQPFGDEYSKEEVLPGYRTDEEKQALQMQLIDVEWLYESLEPKD